MSRMSTNRSAREGVYPQDQPGVTSNHQILGEFYRDIFKEIPKSVGVMKNPRLFTQHDQRTTHDKAIVNGRVWIDEAVSSKASSSGSRLQDLVGKPDWYVSELSMFPIYFQEVSNKITATIYNSPPGHELIF